MVRSGSRLELVGVATGAKLWLANNPKGAVRAKLPAACREAAARQGEAELWSRKRAGRLTTARHSWPCHCPGKRTLVGLSPAPSAGILHPKSGCGEEQQDESRHPTEPLKATCQVTGPASGLQACCRSLRGFPQDPVIPSRQAD